MQNSWIWLLLRMYFHPQSNSFRVISCLIYVVNNVIRFKVIITHFQNSYIVDGFNSGKMEEEPPEWLWNLILMHISWPGCKFTGRLVEIRGKGEHILWPSRKQIYGNLSRCVFSSKTHLAKIGKLNPSICSLWHLKITRGCLLIFISSCPPSSMLPQCCGWWRQKFISRNPKLSPFLWLFFSCLGKHNGVHMTSLSLRSHGSRLTRGAGGSALIWCWRRGAVWNDTKFD